VVASRPTINDFIFIIPLASVSLSYLSELSTDYSLLAAALGIPENHKKNAIERIIVVLSVEIDSESIEARLDSAKLTKAKNSQPLFYKNQDSFYTTQNQSQASYLGVQRLYA
jgi:hypothetical protein